MVKRIFALTLSFVLAVGSAVLAVENDELETIFSKDFSAVGADYDITADGWSVSKAPEYDTKGVKISGNNMNMTFAQPLSAKYEVKLDNYYYEWNQGEICFNTDAVSASESIKNGYSVVLRGQYSSTLTLKLLEYKNGSASVIKEEVWDGANTGAMEYDVEISYDRGTLNFKVINCGNTENTYTMSHDFTEEGSVTDFYKSGYLRIIGGQGGVLRLKGADIKDFKSNLEAAYLGMPFNGTAVYNPAEAMLAQLSINKELSEISAISCYIDGTEQENMAYKDGVFKSNIIYEDSRFKFTLPSDLNTGIHTVKVVFTDDVECKKEYEGKFYVGTYHIGLDGFMNADGERINTLSAAAGTAITASMIYSGVENITGLACLYNGENKLEKIFFAQGENGTVNILCDIPSECDGYTLSVFACEGFVNSSPLSFDYVIE